MHLSQFLQGLGFESTDGPEPFSQIEELERLVGVPLPPEYRRFLHEIGGGYLSDVEAECTLPTPFGEHIINELHSVSQVIDLLDSAKTPRNMICVGMGHFGRTTCVSIAGLDHGQVFSLDTEMRFFWDSDALSRLPDLDPTIKEFFRLRDVDELPERPWGYENCYHESDSFSELLSKLRVDSD